MAQGDRDPKTHLDPRYFPTGAVIDRTIAERPKRDTVDGIIEWLAGPAQHIPSLGDEFDEFAWRLVAAGIPLLRHWLRVPGYPLCAKSGHGAARDTHRTTRLRSLQQLLN